jgi:hypothetical protein
VSSSRNQNGATSIRPTDISEEHRIHLQGRRINWPRYQRESSAFHQLSSWYLAWLILRPWRWRRYVPPKRRLAFNGLHGVISQKLVLFERYGCLHPSNHRLVLDNETRTVWLRRRGFPGVKSAGVRNWWHLHIVPKLGILQLNRNLILCYLCTASIISLAWLFSWLFIR